MTTTARHLRLAPLPLLAPGSGAGACSETAPTDPDRIGRPASRDRIGLPNDIVSRLSAILPPGTPVVIG